MAAASTPPVFFLGCGWRSKLQAQTDTAAVARTFIVRALIDRHVALMASASARLRSAAGVLGN